MTSSRSLVLPLALLLASGLVACGSSEGERSITQQPMTPNSGPLTAAASEAEVPEIRAVRFQPARPRAGHSVRALPSVTGDEAPPHFSYAWSLNRRPLPGTNDSIDLPASRAGDRLEVVVTPRLGARTGTPYSQGVRLSGPAPRIMGISLVPRNGLTAGRSVTAKPLIDGVDADSVSLRYAWYVNGRQQSEPGESFSTEGLSRGDRVHVEISARYAGDQTEPYASEELVLENAPPKVTTEPLAQGDDGLIVTRLVARDPDGDIPLRFVLKQGPPGLELDAGTGRISWDPAEASAGSHLVQIEVSDSRGAVTHTQFELTVDDSVAAAPAPR